MTVKEALDMKGWGKSKLRVDTNRRLDQDFHSFTSFPFCSVLFFSLINSSHTHCSPSSLTSLAIICSLMSLCRVSQDVASRNSVKHMYGWEKEELREKREKRESNRQKIWSEDRIRYTFLFMSNLIYFTTDGSQRKEQKVERFANRLHSCIMASGKERHRKRDAVSGMSWREWNWVRDDDS